MRSTSAAAASRRPSACDAAPARARPARPRAGCRAPSRACAARPRARRSARWRRCPLARPAPASSSAASRSSRAASSAAACAASRARSARRAIPSAAARGGEEAARQLLARARVLGERLLGRLAPLAPPRRAAAPPRRAPRRAAAAALLGLGQVRSRGAQVVRSQLAPGLERLPLEPLVELRRLRLALQRPQPGARLALDVERPGEVVLRALELQLRAPAPLAVLAEPGGLLDQEAPVARLRVDDRLDAALRDDRVHLLAEPGVGQHLEHVDEPAARAVQPVLALAVARELAR